MKAAGTIITRMKIGRISAAVCDRIAIGLVVVWFLAGAVAVFLVSGAGAKVVRGGMIAVRQAAVLPQLGQAGKRPLSFYEGILNRAGVFTAQNLVSAADDAAAAVVLDSGVAASLAELQLQGIISGTRGLQAIIVNSRTEQSFDCQGGESLVGFKVQEVRPDRVILERDGKNYELQL